jgi:hypothetical protein
MAKKEPPAPITVPRETLVTTEGVTTIINPPPAEPEKKETEHAEDARRSAREG